MCDERSLVFLNNRHYNPSAGVFISVDPLVAKTGQPYIYGNANPIRFSDPDGLESFGDLSGFGQEVAKGAISIVDLVGKGGGSGTGGGSSSDRWGPNDPPTPDSTWDCGPPSGPSTAQAAGSCGWTVPGYSGPRLVGPNPDWDLFSILPEPVAQFVKGVGVTAIAVAGGVALCGTGVGCIVVAAAGLGVVANVFGEELIDCAYRTCGDMSVSEVFGDAAEGAVIGGGGGGYLRTDLAIVLGAGSPAIGPLSAAVQYGPGATLSAVGSQSSEIVLVQFLKAVISEAFGS